MSAAEILEEISKLPIGDRDRIERQLQEMRAAQDEPPKEQMPFDLPPGAPLAEVLEEVYCDTRNLPRPLKTGTVADLVTLLQSRPLDPEWLPTMEEVYRELRSQPARNPWD